MKKNLLLIPILIYLLTYIVPSINGKSSDMQISGKHRTPKFISFNTNSGKIEMALDLSLPFLSIPLEGNSGILIPSLNINPKTLTILSVFTILSSLVFPWLLKNKQKPLTHTTDLHHNRTNRGLDFLYLEDSLDEILFQNSQVISCIQRIICWAVASATRSPNPSSLEKIIDGVSSYTWFNKATNGTIIKEAIQKGRIALDPDECTAAYKGCILSQQIITNILQVIEI